MADDHYEWLDKDAAERLLRGEPVDPVGGHACTEAERLAAALKAVARVARPATGELPGESAALTAFRAATHSTRVTSRAANLPLKGYAEETGEPAPAAAIEPARSDALESVHIRPASGGSTPSRRSSSSAGSRTRSLSWSRPIRFGLVASFAGCALGGVAVAAGTGMLPGPFQHTPVPATSVSAAATPEQRGSGDAAEKSPSAQRSASPEAERSTAPARPSSPTGERDDSGTDPREDGPGADSRTPDGTAGGSSNGTEDGTSDGSGNGTSGDWYAKALTACRDYRSGTLDDDRRRFLEALAKGARNLDRFCDRVIAKDANGQNSPGNDNGGDQGDEDESNGESAGSSTLPAIRFTTPPPSPSQSPSAQASPPAAQEGSASAVGSSG